MAIELWLERDERRPALVPMNATWEEALIEEVPFGELLWTGTQPRSAKRLRFYFQLCRKVAKLMQAGGAELSSDDVDFHLRVAVGLHMFIPLSARERARLGANAIGVRVRSLSFDKMDESEMREFVKRAVAYVLTELLPRLPRSELMREVEDLIHAPQRG